MACNCCECCNIISVTSVTSSGGITTINVPTDTTFDDGKSYCLGLFITIPTGTIGSAVNVTNGTNTYTIYNKLANYWRPCNGLKSRTVLKLRFFNDPSHFVIK